MKELTIDLPSKFNKIQILPLGDMHIGDGNCDLDSIKTCIEYIKNTENCYTILNGDLMNNALKSSKSDSYLETMTMEQEQDLLIELLKPIKDKILYMTQGNHEYRTSLLVGIDPLRSIARELGLLANGRYSDNTYFLTLLMGKRNGESDIKNTYTIFGMHGSGGGRRIGGTANSLEDMASIVPNADLYIHSHTHQQLNFTKPIFVYNQNNKELEYHNRVFYNTNSFVKYGGYAERKGLSMTDTSPSLITIEFRRKGGKMIKITDIVRL